MQFSFRFDAGTAILSVSLSERNLLDLLAQTHVAGSSATVLAHLQRVTREGDELPKVLYVTVEPDAVHYGERTPGPGSDLLPRVASPAEEDRLRQERDSTGVGVVDEDDAPFGNDFPCCAAGHSAGDGSDSVLFEDDEDPAAPSDLWGTLPV